MLTKVADRSIEHFLRWLHSEGIEFSRSYKSIEMKDLISNYEKAVDLEEEWKSSNRFSLKYLDKEKCNGEG